MCFFNKSKKDKKIKAALDKGAILLDVRSSSEFANDAIENSVHIPFQEVGHRFKELDKSKPIIAYCHMGGRSTMATNKLRKQGYDVIDGISMKRVKKLQKQTK